MKLTTNYAPLFAKTDKAFGLAVKDTEDAAKENAGRSARTGKFRDSIKHTLGREGEIRTARVGSPLVSARVKEKGGYMQASSDTLYLPAGDGSVRRPEAVRVRATPVVTPAAKRFPEFMSRRMREAAGR